MHSNAILGTADKSAPLTVKSRANSDSEVSRNGQFYFKRLFAMCASSGIFVYTIFERLDFIRKSVENVYSTSSWVELPDTGGCSGTGNVPVTNDDIWFEIQIDIEAKHGLIGQAGDIRGKYQTHAYGKSIVDFIYTSPRNQAHRLVTRCRKCGAERTVERG